MPILGLGGAPSLERVVLALTTIGGDLRAPEAVLALEGEADGRVLTLTRASALVGTISAVASGQGGGLYCAARRLAVTRWAGGLCDGR